MAEFNRQARFEGDDPRFLVGGGESPGRPVSLPQDVLAFLRNNHEGPIINGDNFIARVSADGVCTVFTTDHLVDSGAVLSDVNDDRVVFSVNGTETVGQFRFPVPDGVACVASLAQEGSGFEPGTALVRFFRDNGKAGAQVLNEEPIRPLVNAPNRIELVKLESGFMLVTTDADGEEIEKQTVDTKDWAVAETPEDQLSADMENWNMTTDKYNVGYDKEGKIELREKGTNKLIYWDGKWSSEVIVDMVIATNDCQATEFVPVSSTANWVEGELEEEFATFRQSIYKKAIFSPFFVRSPGPIGSTAAVPFKGTDNCWGLWFNGRDGVTPQLAWLKADGEVEVVSVFESQ